MREVQVQGGDTLAGIASRAGTTVSKLQSLNGIRNPKLIAEGQTIKLPVNKEVQNVSEETA
ncbi:hypothetical protein EOPP23_16930 [Endozoicomonas sp. OPT23]|uniref:LysM peptidoglycan-binding domain-containing protein n=1 Tax=Endozoicomonas sp. OPT23 TaxID=2072845 RepID=UPI001D3F8DEE|nr:hypothetical protein [Endozoicomonas sp. OPT23]